MKWFEEKMSRNEARRRFFKIMAEKPKDAEKIKMEYKKVLAIIIPRELKENEFCLTNDSLQLHTDCTQNKKSACKIGTL